MTETTTVYLVRHGETEWNRKAMFQGWTDVALSEEGRQQARLLARRLRGLSIDGIYASDLSRAVETAEIIAADLKKPVAIRPELREICLGSWEGRCVFDVEREEPELFRVWREQPHELSIPNWEGLSKAQDRLLAGIYKIVDSHPGETVLIVTHGAALRLIFMGLLGMPLQNYHRFRFYNTSFNEVIFDNGTPYILRMNDTCHLD